jgi:MFS family permease
MFSLLSDRNVFLLCLTRFLRLFSYGLISVSLFSYLLSCGLSQPDIAFLLTAILLGDIIGTFLLTTRADWIGRRYCLLISAFLKTFSGFIFASSQQFYVLLLAGIVGIISPSGGEIGPFLAIEQASLTEASHGAAYNLPTLFGFYNLLGYFAQALGALTSGALINYVQNNSVNIPFISTEFAPLTPFQAYRLPLFLYSFLGFVKFILYLLLSAAIEPLHPRDPSTSSLLAKFGLRRRESSLIVLKLSLLFILDAAAGGLVMQTVIVFYFNQRFHLSSDQLGLLMMGSNVLAGISALAASPLVARIGAVPTMVFTHFPSNILLLLIPFCSSSNLAVFVLLVRFSISQMDVPARQTFTVMVVEPDERSAAGGITNLVRSFGMAMSPLALGYLLADPSNSLLFGAPFVIAGALKCVYDILLYISFSRLSAATTDSKGEYKPIGTKESTDSKA